MSKTRRKHKVSGVSPEGVDHEWTGCGWAEKGRGKRYSHHDADMVAFDINCEGSDWVAFREMAEPI